MKLKLKACVNRSDAPDTPLSKFLGMGSVRKAGDEFVVEAEMEGASARELNCTFLSVLRKVEKRTTLRAEWTSDDGISERFFDHVLMKIIRSLPPLCDYAAGLGCHLGSHSAGIWPPGRGSGRLGRFRGAGSLCDHPGDDV